MSPPPPPPAFVVGQRYSCDSVDPARRIEVVVGRIDEWPKHVTVVSVSLTNAAGNTEISEVAHMPFDAAVLRMSCRTLLASGVGLAPEFEEGYRTWRADHGGYYTISPNAALDVAITTLTQGTRTK